MKSLVLTLCLLAPVWLPAADSPVPLGNPSLRNEVRRAVDKGLNWLRTNQAPEGFWSTADHPAVTAIALAALSTGGYSAPNAFSNEVSKAFAFIAGSAHEDGSIYRKKELINYNTSVSVMGLLASQKPEATPLILRARRYLIGTQVDFDSPGVADNVFDGGVGYGSRYQHSDMANTLQALEAIYHTKQLAADRDAGKDLNWKAAIQFLQNCQNLPAYNKQKWVSEDPADQGGFVYYPGQSMAGETNLASGQVALRSYGSISYAGLLSYIYADLKKDDPRVRAVFEWLQTNFTLDENPRMGPQGLFYYYHTMAKALNLYGVDVIEKGGEKIKWREQLALRLINLQKPDGSWANENGRWWEKDTALVTAYAVISLEIAGNKL